MFAPHFVPVAILGCICGPDAPISGHENAHDWPLNSRMVGFLDHHDSRRSPLFDLLNPARYVVILTKTTKMFTIDSQNVDKKQPSALQYRIIISPAYRVQAIFDSSERDDPIA